jgi:four helix bundle protein
METARQSDNQTMGQPENQPARKAKIVRLTDLEVYQRAFKAAMGAFQLSKSFPKEERFSLTDQLRRASRSVAANISEGWRKRRYAAAFVSKLNDSEGEAAETQSWLQFAVECEYQKPSDTRELYREYDELIGQLVNMQNHPEQWTLTRRA